ncbi:MULTISPECIES: pilus assembly PilX family protein [Giesbergeria]|uniref:PilX N-terminal domain-containing pilus assembly protein n=1 Tax=Giesbergeria sinuosa TaxID=80883 RepID=A0ABV9QAJ9_9BURK
MNNIVAKPQWQKKTKNQQGIVLAISLILLVILSMVAIYAMRSSVSGEQVAKNIRSSEIAAQSAEFALRFCEDRVRYGNLTVNGVTIKVHEQTLSELDWSSELAAARKESKLPMVWNTKTNWAISNPPSSSDNVFSIPIAMLANENMPQITEQKKAPRCMVELYRLRRAEPDVTLSDPYLITTVGFSPDYEEDSSGRAIAGSQYWLQSIFRP